MDTSAVYVSRLSSSSILFSHFSDQSHVDFYYRCPSFSSLSIRSLPPRSFRSASPCIPSFSPLRVLCDNTCSSPLIEPATDQTDLMMELAQLKLQMKLKKKELKAQKKDEKKRVKMQMKEGKKMMKQKDATEGKKKKKCLSESSSSSESSDGECESMSMKILRQGHSLLGNGEEGMVQKDVVERDVGLSATVQDDCITTICGEGMSGSDSTEAEMAIGTEIVSMPRERPLLNDTRGCGGSSSIMSAASSLLSVQSSNRVEVCAGGKCKKAGSEHLLSTLRSQIPSASNVEVVACKCMGKCSMMMNVKVHKEDTNPQHHSQVRVEDANLILSHHFGLGRPPSGLPNISSLDMLRAPLQTAA